VWRDYHRTEYAIEGGVLYLKVAYPATFFAPPRGAAASRESYDRITRYCEQNDLKMKMCFVSEPVLEIILDMFPGAKATTDRVDSDYLYLSDDIKNLAGRKYAGQRNHINHFLRDYPSWCFEKVTADNIADLRNFLIKHARENVKDSDTYNEGNRKNIEVLDNFGLYGQFGGILRVNGEIIGASLGETLGDTLFIHTEKALTKYQGAYPMLMNQFAKCYAGENIVYINREEDDGDEGLRTSKTSYHPVALLHKYFVEI